MRVGAALLLAIFGLSSTHVWNGPRPVQGSSTAGGGIEFGQIATLRNSNP